MKHQINTVTAVPADKGQLLAIAGGSYRIITTGKETGGAFAIIDMLVPPQGGPGPHAHPDFQETFYVLEGEVEVKTEQQKYTAGKGSCITIPLGGIVHCFKNNTDKPAQLLCIVVPAGLEDFFLELGKPTTDRAFLPQEKPDAEQMKKIIAVAEKYGQQLYPPDYLDK